MRTAHLRRGTWPAMLAALIFCWGCGGAADEESDAKETPDNVAQSPRTNNQTDSRVEPPAAAEQPPDERVADDGIAQPRSIVIADAVTDETTPQPVPPVSAQPPPEEAASVTVPPALERTLPLKRFGVKGFSMKSIEPPPQPVAGDPSDTAASQPFALRTPQPAGEFDAAMTEPEEMPQAMAAIDEPADQSMTGSAAAMTDDPLETSMRVFYATDRIAREPLPAGAWSSIFFTTLLTAGLTGVLLLGAMFFQRKVALCALAVMSLLLCIKFGYSANIEWQKRVRLARGGDAYYSSEMNDGRLDYGTCQVNIPPDHRIGALEAPSILKLEFREDPRRHVILERVIRSDEQTFFNDLNHCLDESGLRQRQAFVFVHGYNVSFEDAVKRTAQIAFDLRFNGAPICYSWSSHGGIESYIHDMANADSTVIRLEQLLRDVVERTRSTTVHLVAHSMGNRALLQALDRIAVSQSHPEPVFGQLVMAAPDVSSRDFRTRYAEAIRQVTQQATLYASSSDRALMASTSVHGHNRAGLAGEQLVIVNGVDTIDVSEIDTSLIGHSYYGENPKLIDDMRALVELSQPADRRTWLARFLDPDGSVFYKFR